MWILNLLGTVSLSQIEYGNPFFFLAASLAGWAFLYSLAYFLKQLLPVKRVLTEVGRRTLSVMIFHFLAFKIVAVAVAAIYGLPMFCVAAFPNLRGNTGFWWIAYVVVGVAVPVAADYAWHLAVEKVTGGRSRKNPHRMSGTAENP